MDIKDSFDMQYYDHLVTDSPHSHSLTESFPVLKSPKKNLWSC